ncbi:MAG: hypothetical protein U1F30_02565 [Steroidobacteraceae bacterium]
MAMRVAGQREAARLVDGFGVGELVTVLAVIAVVTGMAIHDGALAVRHAQLAEAFVLASGPKVAWMERFAMDGTVPGPIPAPDAAVGQRANDATASVGHFITEYLPGAGGFAFRLGGEAGRNAGGLVGFRVAVGPGEIPATLVWQCGHRRLSPAWRALGPDQTTLGDAELPSGCRGS